MRAALYRRPGPAAEVLEVVDLETPEPGPDEVRVRVAVSGINPTDWKTRAGVNRRRPDGFQIPHHDGSGVVDAVGSDVAGLAAGQRVWTYLAAYHNRFGTAAEYAVLPATRVVPLPDSASDELGACLGVPALTAAHCLGGSPDELKDRTVLVAGGAGAVGHFAIELARHAGAEVVATVSSDAKADLARSAGADHVLNYTEPGVARRIGDLVGGIDRVIEVAPAANMDLDLAVLNQGGTISTYAAEPELRLAGGALMGGKVRLEFVLLYGVPAAELAAAVSWTGNAVAAGALSALPVADHPLDRIAAAHEQVERGFVGKVVVRP